MRRPIAVLLFGLWACSSEPRPPTAPSLVSGSSEGGPSTTAAAPRGATGPLLLARHPELLSSLLLPERSRPIPISSVVRLEGPWTVDHPNERVVQYSQSAPVRGIEWGFGRSQSPADVRLTNQYDRPVRWQYVRDPSKAWPRSWDVAHGALRLRRAAGRPEPKGWTLQVPQLAALERSFQQETAARTPEHFALRTVIEGGSSRFGLFLPAPAEARFEVVGATAAAERRLRTMARLLRPFVPHTSESDGAVVVVQADDVEIHRVALTVDAPVLIDVPVPSATHLTLRTEPGATTDLDYVFLEEPVLWTPSDRPRRILIVLVDTLRADRLGAYGYTRHQTSPVIDQLAARGVRFDQARAPAPWTLPSTRALLSGTDPEAWSPTDHLGHHLARGGFVTAFISTNTYLSRYVDMHRGWTLHDHGIVRTGPKQVQQMRAFLRAYGEHDLAVVLHVMEPHMPYREPESLRGLWAGEKPEALDEDFNVQDLRRAEKRGLIDADIRSWVSDRYDQNVRAADETVALALEAIGPDALVVLTADHGEELWEHGDVEHGHALWEELVRVPLVVVGPGIEPAVAQEPVSLIDVAPTLYARFGVDAAVTGVDLSPLLNGVPMPQLRSRPQAFRNLLYRSDAYGVLLNGREKWITREGGEAVYDLSSDPGEASPANRAVSPFHAALADALGREVVSGWRVALPGAGEMGNARKGRGRPTLTVVHPDGIDAVFPAPDPRERSALDIQPVENGVVLVPVRGRPVPSEVYVVASSRPEVSGSDAVSVTPAVFPMPADPSTGRIQIDADAKEALEALGYLE